MANNMQATGFCSISHCADGNPSDSTKCSTSSASDWSLMKTSSLFTFQGPDFNAQARTADPTPVWNNPAIQAMVTIN